MKTLLNLLRSLPKSKQNFILCMGLTIIFLSSINSIAEVGNPQNLPSNETNEVEAQNSDSNIKLKINEQPVESQKNQIKNVALELSDYKFKSVTKKKKLGKTQISFKLFHPEKSGKTEVKLFYKLVFSDHKPQIDEFGNKWHQATLKNYRKDSSVKFFSKDAKKIKTNKITWLSKNDLGTGDYIVDTKIIFPEFPDKEYSWEKQKIFNRPPFSAFLFPLMGGLGIFLFGMVLMSEGLQAWAGDSLRRLIKSLTANRVMGVIVGCLVTCIVQSSSVTTVMTVGFVNAGLMTLKQAIGIVFGANVGTTITGWIIAIKITKFSLPILGVGTALYLFAKRAEVKYLGQIMLGFGMVFFGLGLMKNGFSPFKTDPLFSAWFMKFNTESFLSLCLCALTGCILTIIVQSSSATLGITMAMAATGLISYETSVGLVLGENIGTTITAWLASIKTNVNAKRVARSHMIFNTFGVAYMLIIFPYYTVFIDNIVPGDAHNTENVIAHIAMAHTFFNIFNTIVFVFLIDIIVKVTTWMIPDQASKEKKKLLHLSDVMIPAPTIALEQANLEIIKMGDIVKKMMESSFSLFENEKNRDRINQIFKYEKITDDMQYEVSKFLFKVFPKTLRKEEAQEARRLLEITEEFESIADNCERITKYYNRLRKHKEQLHPTLKTDLDGIFNLCQKMYNQCYEGFKEDNRAIHRNIEVLDDNISRLANEIREKHMSRLDAHQIEAPEALVFGDIIIACRRFKNHCMDLAEAISR